MPPGLPPYPRTAIIAPETAASNPMYDSADALFESAIPDYPLIGRGKVRDIYSIDNDHLLIVTTDRLSAFDPKFE